MSAAAIDVFSARRGAALVTGAAKRVGREIALELAGMGWAVALHYHRSRGEAEALMHEITQTGGQAICLEADFKNTDEVSRLIGEASRLLGPVSCLVNNAASFVKDSLETVTPEGWRTQMALNLLAPMILIREFVKQCPATGGSIINLTDGLVGWSVSANYLSYSMSKQGLDDLTRLLAPSLAPHIRINAIAPGHTLPAAQEGPESAQRRREATPLKHLSNPQEVCEAVRYLLAAPSVTGQCLALSGGMHLPPVLSQPG